MHKSHLKGKKLGEFKAIKHPIFLEWIQFVKSSFAISRPLDSQGLSLISIIGQL